MARPCRSKSWPKATASPALERSHRLASLSTVSIGALRSEVRLAFITLYIPARGMEFPINNQNLAGRHALGLRVPQVGPVGTGDAALAEQGEATSKRRGTPKKR
jgi:hypothetical protein